MLNSKKQKSEWVYYRQERRGQEEARAIMVNKRYKISDKKKIPTK